VGSSDIKSYYRDCYKAPRYEHHDIASVQLDTSFGSYTAEMSSSQVPTSPPTDADSARTIVYDPNDPFWRDTDDDDDDMDFVPAETGSEDAGDAEDAEGELSFHGMYQQKLRELHFVC